MSTQTIGTGAVVLTADADGLLKGLKKAEKDTASWADRTGKKINGTAESLEKLNKIPALLGLGLTGAIASLGGAVGSGFSNLVTKADQFNKAMERSIELNEKLAKVMDHRAEANAARLEALSATPAGRLAEIENQLKAVDAEVGAAEKGKHLAVRERDLSLIQSDVKNGHWAERQAERARLGLAYIAGQLETYQKPFEDNLKAADERLQKALELRRVLNLEKDKILDPERDIAKIGEILQLTEAFKVQTATLGKTETAAKALELSFRGFTEGQISRYKVAADIADKTAEGFDRVATAVGGAAGIIGGADYEKMKAVTDAIKKQGDTLGFTANELQRYELKLAGFADRQIKEIEKLQDKTEALVNVYNVAAAIAGGVKDAKMDTGGPYLAGAAQARTAEAYSQVANFRAGNAVAGFGMSDSPVQIAKENLKNTKEQIRKLQRLVDLLERSQFIKVVT
ncbi:unnamed protein product [Gemmata massiliana]|uniref:Uncharacterized protein n=1 Tax=Gemmata massiliana TaxID=1210884 RepID=A0A6P2CSZ1_9BACT|nr:hypothetical protein [Gemmata massiliana]VTR90824.1 unnamed protein product [Gemmata massiliana]